MDSKFNNINYFKVRLLISERPWNVKHRQGGLELARPAQKLDKKARDRYDNPYPASSERPSPDSTGDADAKRTLCILT
jgi:hypothetical protein